MGSEALEMGQAVWEAMAAHAEACLPEECCGMAAGTGEKISRVFPVENSLHSPLEFRMDAAGQFRAMMQIQEAGMEILAIFHSHPAGEETPSETDIKEYRYPEAASIILTKTGGTWSGRCFRIKGHEAREIPLRIR